MEKTSRYPSGKDLKFIKDSLYPELYLETFLKCKKFVQEADKRQLYVCVCFGCNKEPPSFHFRNEEEMAEFLPLDQLSDGRIYGIMKADGGEPPSDEAPADWRRPSNIEILRQIYQKHIVVDASDVDNYEKYASGCPCVLTMGVLKLDSDFNFPDIDIFGHA
jgi:hypothetical protein